jgi:hypothetical protein
VLVTGANAFMEKRPWRNEISVILVNEDLGLGWDETWPEERIEKYGRITKK